MTVRDALNSALSEEMAADSSVFVMGEEVIIIVYVVVASYVFRLTFIYVRVCRLENTRVRIRLGSKIIEFDELIRYAFVCYWFCNDGFVITWIDY